jgi:DNA-binding NarL/FixJ family response regulator
MTKIMIVDDQQLMVDGIKVLLGRDSSFEVVDSAQSGEAAIELTKVNQPHVILMDIRMPGVGGVEATRLIKQLYPEIIVLILTTFDDDEYIIDALNYGASGYLLKDIGSQKLIESIHEALAGNLLITGKVAHKLASSIRTRGVPKLNADFLDYDFTERELTVAKLLKRGFNNREISEELGLTQGTVKNYLTTIYSKLGVTDRGKAIILLGELISHTEF